MVIDKKLLDYLKLSSYYSTAPTAIACMQPHQSGTRLWLSQPMNLRLCWALIRVKFDLSQLVRWIAMACRGQLLRFPQTMKSKFILVVAQMAHGLPRIKKKFSASVFCQQREPLKDIGRRHYSHGNQPFCQIGW